MNPSPYINGDPVNRDLRDIGSRMEQQKLKRGRPWKPRKRRGRPMPKLEG